MKLKLIVVILTYNEEVHIKRAIENVIQWADKVIVLDSYSQDNTIKIAEKLGAEVIYRKFDDYKNQRQHAIDYCKNITEWMFFLDADEYLLDDLKLEINDKINIRNDIDGYYVARRAIFMNKWIRYGGYYPCYFLRLFQPETAKINGIINEHVTVSGKVEKLKFDIVDHNLKSISCWIEKHNNYTSFEAKNLWILKKNNKPSKKFNIHVQAERKQWIKQKIWNNFPLLLRPFIYFIYRYFIRLGFLDGKEGLIYHALQGGWNYFLVDVKYMEMKLKSSDNSLIDMDA